MAQSIAVGSQRLSTRLLVASGVVLLALAGFAAHAAFTTDGGRHDIDSIRSLGVLVTADAPMEESEVVVVSAATTSTLSDVAALEPTAPQELLPVNPMPAFANSVGVSAFEGTIGHLAGTPPVLEVGVLLP